LLYEDAECRRLCKQIKEIIKKGEPVPIYLPINAFEKEYSLSQRNVIFNVCLSERA
jgi:hypothetical protein